MSQCDLLLDNCRLATFVAGGEPYGLIDNGAVAIIDDRLEWVGRSTDLPANLAPASRIDCGGRLVTPGLIDCHTHLVWGGDRTDEFEQRLTGVPYEQIARQGGGINSSVRATRAATAEELMPAARRRLMGLAREGVTTVEIKSGYGLDVETESRMLRVARRLGETLPVGVVTSFLGAHAVPPEFAGRSDDYLQLVIAEMLPVIARDGLADAVDAFCENIAFSVPQVEKLFVAAAAHDLPVKLHAEQLTLSGGAQLAARHGALSADHLEYLDAAGARAMADAGTVAVLLPGAYYFLREDQAPPVDLLRRVGVPIAVATDLNPGSSPLHSLLAAVNLSCLLFHLTPEEALAGVTREAARALGQEMEIGTLEVGKRADLALWRVSKPAALVANLGADLCCGRVFRGQTVDLELPEGFER